MKTLMAVRGELTLNGVNIEEKFKVTASEGLPTNLAYRLLGDICAELLAAERPALKAGVSQHIQEVLKLVERGVSEAPPQPGEGPVLYGAHGGIVPTKAVYKKPEVGSGPGGQGDPGAN